MYLSFYLSFLLFFTPSTDYSDIFGEDYRDALRFLERKQAQFVAVCPQGRAAEGMAIVFPELVRYSLLRDLLETQALELFYVDEGSHVVDFSIGRFQMKPSFVEQLEAYTRRHPELPLSAPIASYPLESTEKERRQLRLSRLRKLDWQLRYLAAFQAICQQRFPFLDTLTPAERVRFLAAAYNAGFAHSAAYIRQSATKKLFPYGTHYRGEQYSYAEIAVYFSENHLPFSNPKKP